MATPKYPNGFIPRSELVYIEGNHLATRGTAARWEALKADVRENEHVTLRITGGENAYRSFAGQQFARRNACARGRCNDAAVPGYSSHGGSLNGRDSGAIDVDNWAVLGKAKFYAYARKHGFEPGYFDWEPWHIIDWAPYTVPASAGGGTSTGEIDDMDISEFLNHPAYDNGPTISEFFKAVDQGGVATQVWNRTVARGTAKISALQELADSKTAALATLARQDAMEAAIKALSAPQGLDPERVMAAVEAGVAAAMARVTVDFDVASA